MEDGEKTGNTRLWWTFTGVGAGMATVITLVANSALPKWSIVTLVVFGALFFSGAVYGLGWIKRTPRPLGRPVRAVAALIVILGGMLALGWRMWPSAPGYCFYLAYELGPRWSLIAHNGGDDSIQCKAVMAEIAPTDSEEQMQWKLLHPTDIGEVIIPPRDTVHTNVTVAVPGVYHFEIYTRHARYHEKLIVSRTPNAQHEFRVDYDILQYGIGGQGPQKLIRHCCEP